MGLLSGHSDGIETKTHSVRLQLEEISCKLKAERKRREELEQKRQFRSLIDSALLNAISDAFLLLDPNGRILRINDAMTRWLAIPQEIQLVGTLFWDVIPQATHTTRKKRLQTVLKTGHPMQFEDQAHGRHMQFSIWPVLDTNEKIAAVFALGRDTTLEKTARDRARRQQEQLIQAAKMVALGTLVSGVAHEINNPNNFIMLNVPLLEEAWESALPILEEKIERDGDFDLGGLPYSEMRQHLPELFAGIRDGSQRIKRIVEDLKNFARQESPELTKDVAINSVVTGAVSLLGNLIRKTAPRFRVRYGDDIPLIQGNAQKLEQIAINLIQNACQAVTDRDQRVLVETRYDANRREIRLLVVDEGRGIPADILSHIQDPFFTTKRDNGGTGLGLSISATIAKEHGGRIDVESRENAGSVFTLVLPVRTVSSRKKVLVADDESGSRNVVVSMLQEDSDLEVYEADSGMGACLKLGALKPDLLILDLHMPDMDGIEVCEWVRTEPELAALNVVCVTGYAGQNAMNRLHQLHVPDVLTKPVDARKLSASVRRLLDLPPLSGGGQ